MRGIVLAVSCLLAAANCASAWERSDDAFLKECWGATPLENGAYQLHFEALVIAAVEGGILVRSGTCPDHRMGFARTDPIPDRQLDPIWDAAWGVDEALGLGIRGVVIVSPLERKHEHYLGLRVIALPRLEPMTEPETQRFIRRFNIG
ncbi:hypothetical protein [Allosphingosinicella sp.]|uniref:hypothetical protein n=1 Tax=Allosphingosinicella sp. TaxID=2823234 RepID=UPI002FC23C95